MLSLGPLPAKLAAGAVACLALFACAFVLGRSGDGKQRLDPIKLVHGLAVGVMHSPAGALAAADDYVASGAANSLDQSALDTFADTVVAPQERQAFLGASAQTADEHEPPLGTNVVDLVVAHRLLGYTRASAKIATWQLGNYWGPNLAPVQYSAIADVSLAWRGDRWQITAVDEQAPGPVPARIATGSRTSGGWSDVLFGMMPPYYGAA